MECKFAMERRLGAHLAIEMRFHLDPRPGPSVHVAEPGKKIFRPSGKRDALSQRRAAAFGAGKGFIWRHRSGDHFLRTLHRGCGLLGLDSNGGPASHQPAAAGD